MQDPCADGRTRLAKSTISTVITVAVLIGVRYVVGSLPVFRSGSLMPSSPLQAADLIIATISFLVMLSLVNYAFQVDISAHLMSARFAGVGTVFRQLIFAGAAIYAYFTLRYPATTYMQGFQSIYATVFAIVLGLILLAMVITVYRNNEMIAEAVMSLGKREAVPRSARPPTAIQDGPTCPQCGNPVQPGSKFCRGCGFSLADSTQTQPPPADSQTCPACGKQAKQGERFCRSCGTALPQEAPPSDAASTQTPGGDDNDGL